MVRRASWLMDREGFTSKRRLEFGMWTPHKRGKVSRLFWGVALPVRRESFRSHSLLTGQGAMLVWETPGLWCPRDVGWRNT